MEQTIFNIYFPYRKNGLYQFAFYFYVRKEEWVAHFNVILHHVSVYLLACLTVPHSLTAWAVEQAGGAKAFVRRMSVPSLLLFFSDQVRNLDEP